MSRRGSRNNGNSTVNKYNLSRKKFRKHFCRTCGLCGSSATMRFCFNGLYKQDPVAFADTVFPLMQRNKNDLKRMAEQLLIPDFQDLTKFRNTICIGGCCDACIGEFSDCVKSCYSAFCAQVNNAIRRNAIKDERRANVKVKPEPEMFFAAYGSNTFEAEIMRILEEYAANK